MRLIVVCAAALAGVALGDVSRLEPAWLLFGALLAVLGAGLAWQQPVWRGVALVTLVAALGGLRASLAHTDGTAGTAVLEPYLGLAVRLRGGLLQPPSSGPVATLLMVDVRAIGPAGRDPPPLTGSATASASGSATASASESAAGSAAGLAIGSASNSAAGSTSASATGSASASATGSASGSATGASHGSPTGANQGTPTGAVRVRVVGDPATLQELMAGETVVLEGRLLASDLPGPPTLLFPHLLERAPPPTFEPSGLLGRVRAAAGAGIQGHLPEPQASLAAGVLLGGAGHLDPDFRLQLQRSGLAHVVAIDGFKQVIVAGVLAGVAVRVLGARAGAVSVLLGIIAYTLLTGAHPAAVRAGLMVGLATLASLTGRVADPLTSVLVAATIMAAVDPRILLDVGLQLSLSATLGIVLLWPQLRPRLQGLPHWVAEPAGLTLAVTVATLPVTLSTFQLVSLVSPLAHVVAVPLLPVVLLSAAALALVSPLQNVAAAVAWLAWLPSTLLVVIIRLFGSLPGAALATGRLPAVACGVLAAALLLWGLCGLPEAAGLRTRLGATVRLTKPATAGACLAACLAAGVLLQLVRPDGRLHVQRLAQTRGEAVFIRGPAGRTLLVVGGRLDGAHLADQVAECLAVWEHRLDAVLELDPSAQTGLSFTLGRYPAELRLDAADDARLDLGGGAAVDVYGSAAQATPAVSISFGSVWLSLVGRPPAPDASVGWSSSPPQAAGHLVSDGTDVWMADSAAHAAQLPCAAPLR